MATTIAHHRPQGLASASQPPVHPITEGHDPLASLDRGVERFLGADLRLIYGLLAPVLFICGVIIVLALRPSPWLVVLTLVLEFACLGFVVTKLLAMLGDDEPEADEPTR